MASQVGPVPQDLEEKALDQDQCQDQDECQDQEPQALVDDSKPERPDDDSAKTVRSGDSAADPAPSLLSQAWAYIRPHYFLDHLDYASFKVIARTWLCAWVSIIPTIVPNSHLWIGQASYILPLMVLLVGPGGQSTILVIVTVLMALVFLLFGWTCSIIAQAINQNLRSVNLSTAQITQTLVQSGTCSTSMPAAALKLCVSMDLFSGKYLEPKTTVISVFALFFGSYFMAVARHYHPMFIIPSFMGYIMLCVNVLYGNLLPSYQPLTVGLMVLRPMGLSLAFMATSAILVFPMTSNFVVFDLCRKEMAGLAKIVQFQRDFLAKVRPSHKDFGSYSKMRDMARDLRKPFPLLAMNLPPCKLEASYARTSALDANNFVTSFLNLFNSIASLHLFFHNISDRRNLIMVQNIKPTNSRTIQRTRTKVLYETLRSSSCMPSARYEKRRRMETLLNAMHSHFDSDRELSLEDLDRVTDFAAALSAPKLELVQEAIGVVVDWLAALNKFRLQSVFPWSRKRHCARQQETAAKIVEVHRKLVAVLDSFHTEEWAGVSEDDLDHPELVLALVGQGSYFGFIIHEVVQACARIVEYCVTLDERQPRPQILLPFSKHSSTGDSAISAFLEADSDMAAADDADDEDGAHAAIRSYSAKTPNAYRRNPDALPPDRFYHGPGRIMARVFRLLTGKRSIYGFKTAVAIVLAAMPVYFQSTASWYYKNQIVWATIMVAFSITDIAADNVYGFVSKLMYTFFAAIGGMVAWYISAGNGHGSFYGYAATSLVVFCGLGFYRHFSNHLSPIPAIVLCTSFTLVFAASWQNAQVPSNIVLHWGWKPAWVRCATVAAGLSIAFIISLFPRPVTGKQVVRSLFGKLLKEIGAFHCEIGKFAVQRLDNSLVHIQPRKDYIMGSLRKMTLRMVKATLLMGSLKYEPDIAGRWPKDKYVQLVALHIDLLQQYKLLYELINQVRDPASWIDPMTTLMGWKDITLVSDFFAVIYMASNSLHSGKPLPKISPAQLTLEHSTHLQEELAHRGLFEHSQHLVSSASSSTTEGDQHMSYDQQLAIVGLVIMNGIYQRLDDLMITVKELVGEEFDTDEYFLQELGDAMYMTSSRIV